jgi:hypothetical protein
MKYTSITEDGKIIEYEESSWTGKKSIAINGEILEKPAKKAFVYNGHTYTISGNFLNGAKLVGPDTIIVLPYLKAWQYILVFLPMILPFIGGAIGAIFGVIAAFFSAIVMRKFKNVIAQVLLSLLCTVLAFVCWYIAVVVLAVLVAPVA